MTDIPIGERIMICRKRRGVTQVALAGLINRSVRYLQQVEAGEADPRLSEINEIAQALRMDPSVLTSESFDPSVISGADASSPARRPRTSSRPTMGALFVDQDDAELRYEKGVYHPRQRRLLHNAGDTPITQFLVRISVDRYPGDPERSNELYRQHPLTWDELGLSATCNDEPMTWLVRYDRDAFKEVWLQFESPSGRKFPLYPGESTWIEYSYSVGDDKWGHWYQRAVRWPTQHLSVRLVFPSALEPAVWGTETSASGGANALRTPIRQRQDGGNAIFEWGTEEPPLHARYRLEWVFRREPEHD